MILDFSIRTGSSKFKVDKVVKVRKVVNRIKDLQN
jgi:hypothetical protein